MPYHRQFLSGINLLQSQPDIVVRPERPLITPLPPAPGKRAFVETEESWAEALVQCNSGNSSSIEMAELCGSKTCSSCGKSFESLRGLESHTRRRAMCRSGATLKSTPWLAPAVLPSVSDESNKERHFEANRCPRRNPSPFTPSHPHRHLFSSHPPPTVYIIHPIYHLRAHVLQI